ncbi:hypothetical protein CS8_023660 [Cupriavidus sp. 8B]
MTCSHEARLGSPASMLALPLCDMEDIPAWPVFSSLRSYWSPTSPAEEIGRYEGLAIVVHRVQLEGEREINQ